MSNSPIIEVEYSKATRPEMWQEINRLAEMIENPTNGLPKGELCNADCGDLARKHLRVNMQFQYELKPFGRPDISYIVRGPIVEFCPFCGRRMARAA